VVQGDRAVLGCVCYVCILYISCQFFCTQRVDSSAAAEILQCSFVMHNVNVLVHVMSLGVGHRCDNTF